MKLRLLSEISIPNISKLIDKYFVAKQKGGINREFYHRKKQPYRSGNLETPPADPEHRSLMGIPDLPQSPHGTMADKPGMPTMTASPQMSSLGQPFDRARQLNKNQGISNPIGDDASLHSVDTNENPGKSRLDAPAENPGKQRASTRAKWHSFGKAYPGRRT